MVCMMRINGGGGCGLYHKVNRGYVLYHDYKWGCGLYHE